MKVEIDYKLLDHPEFISVKEIRSYDHDCYPMVVGKIIRELNDKGHTLNYIRLLTGTTWLEGKSLV